MSLPRPCRAALLWLLGVAQVAGGEEPGWFGIHVVDQATGRGVPMVELRTVNEIALFTDSAGWAAFQEPGLAGREVHFAVSSPGYEHSADGFGIRGIRLIVKPGTTAEVKVRRTMIAERFVRLTGQGIYRDSALLQQPVPFARANLNAGVLGQDSVQAVPYGDRIFWLWGDTNLPHYPLGNFRVTAATTPRAAAPDRLDFDYFTEPDNPPRVRGMIRDSEPGAVWLFGLLTVPGESGQPALIAHYSRHLSLENMVEHGLVRFDDASGYFEKLSRLEAGQTWRFPRGNAFRASAAGTDFWYFASPFPHTRVPARLAAVRDPKRYEAFAWNGHDYAWTASASPTTQGEEAELLRAGKMSAEAARWAITDAATGRPITIHGGSVEWNEFRRRWVLIGVQEGDREAPSFLGEVWYAEAAAPTGPWRRAVKIATHPGYSFYNPRQHAFLAADGGRRIFFEGTFTKTFASQPVAIPRYEYNQLLYRLDLEDPRLRPARE